MTEHAHFTGTKAVADSHAFDAAALQTHLLQHLPGFAGPLAVEQFKGGQSNPTYKLLTPTRAYVMRSKPCLLYTSPSPRDRTRSRMPSSA